MLISIDKDDRVELLSRFLPSLDQNYDPVLDKQNKLSKDIMELYIKLMKCTD